MNLKRQRNATLELRWKSSVIADWSTDLQNKWMFRAERNLNIIYSNLIMSWLRRLRPRKETVYFFVYSQIQIQFLNFSMYKPLLDLEQLILKLTIIRVGTILMSCFRIYTNNSVSKCHSFLNTISILTSIPTHLPTHRHTQSQNFLYFWLLLCLTFALDISFCKWEKNPTQTSAIFHSVVLLCKQNCFIEIKIIYVCKL